MSLCFFVFFFFFFCVVAAPEFVEIFVSRSVFRVFKIFFAKKEEREERARESFIIVEHRREKN